MGIINVLLGVTESSSGLKWEIEDRLSKLLFRNDKLKKFARVYLL
jgi:hypothetical protein